MPAVQEEKKKKMMVTTMSCKHFLESLRKLPENKAVSKRIDIFMTYSSCVTITTCNTQDRRQDLPCSCKAMKHLFPSFLFNTGTRWGYLPRIVVRIGTDPVRTAK